MDKSALKQVTNHHMISFNKCKEDLNQLFKRLPEKGEISQTDFHDICNRVERQRKALEALETQLKNQII
ncbi:hypothetical protein A1QO_02780 [Vibrio genomosp. F10 str. ZF-129]|uniref:Uncharacterized protein n=1 Tax=Vibrio genomosp. F10 str. ZF-129 TaxID=1187848 RepID=A0A1E5BKC4_9VIBR|nr:hypothetical protein [Vibrio genomosp. F10]OEE38321.1 hypothetical protein A1QO_02780 [Vibrio genomosp. F10 str. ZF-129]